MKRVGLFFAYAMAGASVANLVLGQEGTDDRSDRELNVLITLEDGSKPRAAVADLPLPLEQESGASPASPEQERRFEPAGFARPNRLESIQITVDDLPRGTSAVAVRCQGIVGTEGGLGDYHCVSDDNIAAEDVIHAVIDAVPAQRFVAARVDGQNVRVLMNFAVYIDCSSGSCLAVAARNHGYHIGKLGIDYVDPQPILAGDNWYAGFDYKLRWIRESQRSRFVPSEFADAMRYVMAAEIDASGIAGPGCLYWVGVTWGARTLDIRNFASGAISRPIRNTGERAMSAPVLPPRTIADIKRAVASLSSVRYVPGMTNGAPTTLRLYEETLTRFQLLGDSNALFSVADIDCK
jgi:hypothetical protein